MGAVQGVRCTAGVKNLVVQHLAVGLLASAFWFAAMVAPAAAREFRVGGNLGDIAYGPDHAAWVVDWDHHLYARVTKDGHVKKYVLKQAGSPEGIVSGHKYLWITSCCNLLIRVTPRTGQRRLYEADSNGPAPFAPPTIGPDGAVWFAASGGGTSGPSSVVRMSPGEGFKTYALPSYRADSLGPITSGPDHALWFLDQARYDQNLNTYGSTAVWRVNPFGHHFRRFRLPTNAYPLDIAAGGGSLWVTEDQNDEGGKFLYANIVRISTVGDQLRYRVPGYAEDIVRGRDNAMWFAGARGRLGRIDFNGNVSTFQVPHGKGGGPYSLAVAPNGDLWYTDEGKVGRFTPR